MGSNKIKTSCVGLTWPLSESVLEHVVGLTSAWAVWVALERCFASLSRSHIIRIISQLQTVKNGTQAISEYIQKIKHVSDSPVAVCCPVDDEDLIIHTLNGLPSEYGPFKTSIRTCSSRITIEELHVLLLCEELNRDTPHQSVSDLKFYYLTHH